MIRLWATVMLLCLVALALTGRDAARAATSRRASSRDLSVLHAHASELIQLRAARKSGALPPKPATGLAPQVSVALARSGLASSIMQSLSPETQTGISDAIRQRATLTLSGLTLPQLGAFLSAWRFADGPHSTITSIDLSPIDRGNAAPGADLPLRAVLVFEGLFRDAPVVTPPAQQSRSGAHP